MNKLVQIRKYLGITQSQLADILRVKQNTISLIENEKILLVDRNKQVLIEKLGVNPKWLETGEGSIFIGRSSSAMPPSLPVDFDQNQRNIIEYGEKDKPGADSSITHGEQGVNSRNSPAISRAMNTGVPYYSKPVTGSLLDSHDDMDKLEPEYFIDFSPLNNCSFYRPIYGESMSPRYNPGDIVACQKIHNREVLMYGQAYLCMIKSEADYYETVKILRRHESPDKVILKSINPDFDDTVISFESIIQLYIIRGKIERNF